MANKSTKQLLVQSAIVLALTATPALAADLVVSTAVTSQYATTANDDDLSITAGGTLQVAGDEAVQGGDDFTNAGIIVNATAAGTEAIKSTGDFSTINFNDDGNTINAITITTGTVTGAATTSGKGTILIEGAADSYTISTGANGSITNTGTAGDAVVISGTNGDQTATISNAGTISTTNNASSIGISLVDANGGSSVSLTNTGTLSAGALGTAINVATGGNTLTVASNTGTITGAITAAGASTVTVTSNTGTIAGNITTATGALAITQTGAGAITGNVTTTSGDADISLAGTGGITGNVNLGSNSSSTLIVGSGTTVTGNVTFGHASQTLTLNGSVVGAIDGAGAEGIVTIDTAGTTTLSASNTIGATGVASVDVTAGDTLKLHSSTSTIKTTATTLTGTLDTNGANHTFTGTGNFNVAAAGVIKLNDETLTANSGGTFTTASGSQINTTISATNGTTGAITTAGKITTGTSATNAGTIVNLTVDSAAGYIADGATFTLVDGSAGTAADLTDDTTQIRVNGASGANSNATTLITFDSTGSGSNDLIIKAERVAINTVGDDANADKLGDALDAIGATGGTELDTLQTTLQNATTAGAVNSALEAVLGQTDNSLTTGTFQTVDASAGLLIDRLDGFRTGAAGVASGESHTRGIWIQGFGSQSEQDTVSGIAGYDADTYGIAIGADKKINDRTRLGLSASYAVSDIDSKTSGKTTDVDSYQINLYGDYNRGNYYVDGVVGAAFHSFDGTRVPVAGTTAKADYDGQTYLAKVAGGYVKKFDRGFDVTPNVSLTFANNQIDDYTETGAGALNLQVDNEDTNVLEGRAGVNVGYNINKGSIKARPEIRASYGYDFIGDEQTATNNFSGVATTFKTNGADTDEGRARVGAGLDIMKNDKVTLSADYDYDFNSEYQSHAGQVRLRYEF